MAERDLGRAFQVSLRAALLAVAMLAAAPTQAQQAAPDGSDELNLQHTKPGAPLAPGGTLSGKFLAGRHASGVRATKEAANYLLEVLKADPDNVNLMSTAFGMLIADGRVADALPLGERLIAANPGANVAQLVLGVDALKRGDRSKAARHIAALPAGGPNVILAPLLTGWTMVAQGDVNGALELTRTNLDLSQMGILRDLQVAMMADVGGNLREADQAFQQVVANRERMSLKSATAYASFLARNNRRADALQILADYVEANPDSPGVQPLLARLNSGQAIPAPVSSPAEGAAEVLYTVASLIASDVNGQSSGNLGPAAQLYVQLALYLRPGDPYATVLLAQIQERDDNFEGAIATLERVRTDAAFGWTARMAIASDLSRLDRKDDAIAALKLMVDERRDRTDAAEALADLYRQGERYAEAITAYSTAIDRLIAVDANDWRLFFGRGIGFERTKQWPQAESDFLKALELQPEQPAVLNYLGYSWVELGLNLDRARDMIQRAVQLRPRDGYIVDSLGWVLFRLGDYEGAVRYLERAVQLQPGDPVINDHLGDAYFLAGRKNEARFQWLRALNFKPETSVKEVLDQKVNGRGLPVPLPPPGRGG